MSERPRLAITVGDPAGIGPEVTAKALNDPAVRALADYVVFGDRRLWSGAAAGGAGAASSLATFEFQTVPVHEFSAAAPGRAAEDSGPAAAPGVTLVEFPEIDYSAIPVGQATAAGGEVSIRYLLSAIAAIKAGRLDGLVTGPINKEAIKHAGYPWPGHTELLAEQFGSDNVAMMFAGGPFRVVLATIHCSLAEVLRSLSQEKILRIVRLADEALRRLFGIPDPRIGVCGLNPHAGEAGRFGREEIEIIVPALEAARREGLNVIGPLPADTVFRQAMVSRERHADDRGKFDIIVAMYHDQGLIPIKTVAFEESVNITIGIPAIRTSVDHGTAFDIAGQDLADPSSMKSAIRMAVMMHRAAGGADR